MPCKGEELHDEGGHEHEHAHEDTHSEISQPIPLKPTQPMAIPGSTPTSFDDTLQSFVEMSLRSNGATINDSSNSARSAVLVDKADVKRPPSAVSWEQINALPGEDLKSDHVWDMYHCRVFLTNYRLIIVTDNQHGVCSMPAPNIDSVQCSSDDLLKVLTKDGRIFGFRAKSSDVALHFYKVATLLTCGPRRPDEIFAYRFSSACQLRRPAFLRRSQPSGSETSYANVVREYAHCGFKEDEWRVTKVNEDFSVCASYPQYLIVPSQTSDEELRDVKRGRFFDRFPAAVWRARRTGAVLLRSAQPETSFFGALPEGDAKLFCEIRKNCLGDKKLMMVMDARSYTAAWANRAKGGGFESGEAYAGTEMTFMSLPNIHSVRYGFHQLRQLISDNNPVAFFTNLQQSNWFQYLYSLILSAQRLVDYLCIDGLSVLVHCSDGWDRTSQLVSLAKLIADAKYRTCEGFEYLITREWIEFGHKFNDRNGLSADSNEKAPVFLQFLDAVHQLWLKNPDRFEFNQRYLMKMAQHLTSGLFGSFLFNNHQEALSGHLFNSNGSEVTDFRVGSPDDESIVNFAQVPLVSVFDYLGKHNHTFVNPLFDVNKKGRLMVPKGMWELSVWREVFCYTDAESLVNTPETVPSNDHGEGPDRPNGMSRSQSAASLNSTDQTSNNVLHGPGLLNSAGVQPNTMTQHNGYGTTSSFMWRRDHGSWKHHLDVDGLSRVSIDYEDRVVELHRHFSLNDCVNRTSESSSGRDAASVDEHRSNDSTMSYDMLEDDGIMMRRKRDSNSSNLLFQVDMPSSSTCFGSLNEEVVQPHQRCR